MATMNSLLFLFSTLAPNMEPPGNLPVTVTPEWVKGSVPRYGQTTTLFFFSIVRFSSREVNSRRIITVLRGYFSQVIRQFTSANPMEEIYRAPALLTQIACGIPEALSCKSHCQKNCSNYDHEIPCPDICVLGCVCIDPFLRATDGSCIMPYECPANPDTPVTADTTDDSDEIQCQPDEEVSHFAHCQRNCTNLGEMIFCPGEGPRGCVCKSPKIRGPEGNCIMSDQCPRTLRSPQDDDDDVDPDSSMTCPPNEDVSCFSHCQVNCTNFDKNFPCPMYCVTGCICKPPLLRGPDGSCIMPDQCNVLKKTPERFDAPSACLQEKETGSCRSYLPRYYFNKETGNCESFIYGGCRGNSNNFNTLEDCEAVCKVTDSQCEDSEDCNDSEDENENEVLRGPFDNLKTCEDQNEVYKLCSSKCPDTCENYKDTRRVCKFICSWPKCECKDGFVRGPNGKCIEPNECSQSETSGENCPENEEYKECGTACQKTCQNYYEDEPCTAACESGCFCKEPMIRGPDGNCIYKEECSAKLSVSNKDQIWPPPYIPPFRKTGFQSSVKDCSENEEYNECGTACQKNCQNYDEDEPCTAVCESGCFCKEPMIRGPYGNCIYKEECPTKMTESSKVLTWTWPDPELMPLRRKANSPSSGETCRENEEYKECGTACQKTCQNYYDDAPCTAECESGCFCKEPMVRGPDGNCIYIEECSAKLSESSRGQIWPPPYIPPFRNTGIRSSGETCRENEEYKECGTACQKTCQNYDDDTPCTAECESGCFCKEPMVRGPDGNCVYKEECSAKLSESSRSKIWPPPYIPPFRNTGIRSSDERCPENEEYKECGTACQKNCQNYDRNTPCEFKCESGCFCKEPMIRGPSGKCIYREDCPAKANDPRQPRKSFAKGFLPDFPTFKGKDWLCKQNEEFSLCAPLPLCHDDCTNYQEDRFCKRACMPGCKCLEGYVKGKEGICIKIEECEEKKTDDSEKTDDCSDLEVYEECGSYCEKDCRNYNEIDRKCEDSRCKKGCFCKGDLVRSPDGKCISPENCPAPTMRSWSRRYLKSGAGRY